MVVFNPCNDAESLVYPYSTPHYVMLLYKFYLKLKEQPYVTSVLVLHFLSIQMPFVNDKKLRQQQSIYEILFAYFRH